MTPQTPQTPPTPQTPATSRTARPPVVVVGGAANALSVARSLGPLGVRVHGLGVPPSVSASRYVEPLPVGDGDPEQTWPEVLLGRQTDGLRGAVVLAGSDAGITVLARHRERLLERFRLDLSDVDAQLAMLDKLATYKLAVTAGVPTPRFWEVGGIEDLARHEDEYVFPLIVKPLLSHRYQAVFPDKFRVVGNLQELRAAFVAVQAAGLAVMLVEQIPGPDSQLVSYYTYIDETGRHTFDFTKRVLRRFPPGMGLTCHHVTDWNPAVRDVALQLFKHVGLRGLGNAEFKLDTRDGQLKLIECNARFTDANVLVAAAGLDLARYVYFRAIGEPHELPTQYRSGLRMVYLSNDFRSFLTLRRRGELTFGQWLGSQFHPQTFPFLRLSDPAPAVMRAATRLTSFTRSQLPRR